MVQNKKTVATKKPPAKVAPKKVAAVATVAPPVRHTMAPDMEFDDDLLPSGGNTAFGRCGGREITNRIEQMSCTLLQSAGIAHTHSPRFFEVRFSDKQVGAYSPEIVLRGRGREGKTVILETSTSPKDEGLKKIVAFRKQYGIEFYLIMIGKEEVLDEVPLEAFDESCTLVDLPTLVGRLSD